MRGVALAIGLAVALTGLAGAAQAQGEGPDRSILPIPRAPAASVAAKTLQGSTPAWTAPVMPPEGAPNVILILMDDAGFGNASTFGGPVSTPTLDALAADGLRFNGFHVTALCSPTRAALLSGHNHHDVGFGSIAELAGGWPGYDGRWPKSAASVARILQGNGYSTAAFGKWHLTPPEEFGPAGPFDLWPNAQGFGYFWGFLGAETDQYAPLLFENNTILGTPAEKDFVLNEALSEKAITWLRGTVSTAPDRPFFMYFATGASHAPHQVRPEWIAKYEGRFDQGWDRLREETFARQQALGVVPQDAVLPPRDPTMGSWDSLSPEMKALASRQMEVFAAYQEETDHEIGRVLAEVEALGLRETTMVIYIYGDNGASIEGTETGTFNEMVVLNGVPLTEDEQLKAIAAYGGVKVWGSGKIEPHYAAGWAWAGNTPFQWGKQVASHLGGTRDPMVIRWPGKIPDAGAVRSQFLHVTDVTPTILDAAGVPAPREVDGVAQLPMYGKSFLPVLGDASAPATMTEQYFEILGNRGMYKDGWWLACRLPRTPWKLDPTELARFAPGVWDPDADPCELYDLTTDFTQSRDLAAANPQKVAELKALFWDEAARHQVLPLLGGMAMAFGPAYAPPAPATATHTYLPGVQNLSPGLLPNLYARSFGLEARLEVAQNDCLLEVCTGGEGVILAAGDYLGGFSLYVEHGRPRFTYSFLGLKIDTITATEPLPTGAVTLRFDFTADTPGQKGGGGTGVLTVNGKEVGRGRIEHTIPGQYSSYAGFDIGRDNGLPVVPDLVYAVERPFPTQTTIRAVDIDLK